MPSYDLEKIKFATDSPTFQRAVDLYERGKVGQFVVEPYGYSALVLGSRPYGVRVSTRRYDEGDCTCYLGQNDTLCKHMVALAIYAAVDGKPLTEKDKQPVGEVVCSGRLGTLDKKGLGTINTEITLGMRYIKPYQGPSRIWFAYQSSLDEGCNRLAVVVSELPVSEQTASLLVDLLLRLDKKLNTGGIDDSNGTVGGFMEQVVAMLLEYAKLDPASLRAFKTLQNRSTSFGWEEPLVNLITKK